MVDTHEAKSTASGVNVRAIVWTGLTVLGIVAGIVEGVFAVKRLFPVGRPHAPPPPTSLAITQPLPRLQSESHAEIQAFEAEKQAILRSYGWVDQKAGIVRIPIDRAIERLVERQARR